VAEILHARVSHTSKFSPAIYPLAYPLQTDRRRTTTMLITRPLLKCGRPEKQSLVTSAEILTSRSVCHHQCRVFGSAAKGAARLQTTNKYVDKTCKSCL